MSASDVIKLSWTSGSCDVGPCSLAVQWGGLFQDTASFGVSVQTYWPEDNYSAFSRTHRMVLLQDGAVFPILIWYLFHIIQMKLIYVPVPSWSDFKLSSRTRTVQSSILLLLESCLQTCMTYTIAECKVNKLLMMGRETARNM